MAVSTVIRQKSVSFSIVCLIGLAGCATTNPMTAPAVANRENPVHVTVCGTKECLELLANFCRTRHEKPAAPDVAASISAMVDEVSRLQATLPSISGIARDEIKYDFVCDEP